MAAAARRPRIGFLTSDDARDRATWSGTPYYMARALERHCGDVVQLGPVRAWREAWGRVRSGASLKLSGRRAPYHHTLALSREYARRFRARVEAADVDVVFAPAGSTQIAFLETRVPIVYTSDATIARLVDYHPGFTGLDPEYLAHAHEIERRAIHGAALSLYPSEWAASSARQDYGADPARVHVVPYGANLDAVPPRERALAPKPDGPVRLTLLGVNWERKGGPTAYEAVRLLREGGIDARLTVCGCTPPAPLDPDVARVVPRLDKRRPDEAEELSRLLLDSHLLVLPTRNDCYGIVFCEASAHGTPSVAPATGGVPGVVADGENGLLLREGAGPGEYAEAIAALLADPARYRALAASSRDAYEDRLSWDRWGERVAGLVMGLL